LTFPAPRRSTFSASTAPGRRHPRLSHRKPRPQSLTLRPLPVHHPRPQSRAERDRRRWTPVFAPGYGAPFLVDARAGRRAPTMADYHDLVKLAHALPNQDLSGHLLVEPGDLHGDTAHLQMLHAHMIHSDKPFIGSAAGKRGALHTLEMARILFGGDLDDRAVTISLINSLSPLAYSTEMLEALVEFAGARQPVVIAALMMAGSTGPITLAGVLAAQTAELLAGVTLTQLISPGTPVVFGSTSTNIDMGSGALAIGSPELSMLIAAHAQLARRYGLPSRSGGALTDASYPDAQAGFESMMSLLTTVNSGVDFVLHSAGILSSYLAFSYEKLVLDDEMCGMVRRLRQGSSWTAVPSPMTSLPSPARRQLPDGAAHRQALPNRVLEARRLRPCRPRCLDAGRPRDRRGPRPPALASAPE